MLKYAQYCRGLANALAIKCTGKDAEAKEALAAFEQEFGKYEVELERYYDHTMAVMAHLEIFNTKSEYAQ